MKKIFYFLFTLSIGLSSKAQQAHFTQFQYTPMYLNPANTGVMNRDIRASLSYRDQARTVANPYSSAFGGVDACIFPKGSSSDFFGAGFMAGRHSQGLFSFSTTMFALSGSYTKAIDRRGTSFLSFGFMGGFSQQNRSPYFTDLTWDSQWDVRQSTFVANTPSNEEDLTSGGRRNFNYADVAFGAMYNSLIRSDIQISAGYSAFHLTRPNISFSNGFDAKRNIRHTFHGMAEIATGTDGRIRLTPSLIYLRQGPQQMINVGFGARFILGVNSKYTEFNKESSFYVGMIYRYRDAVCPVVRYQIKSYMIGVSYDATLSRLRYANNGVGAFEVSIVYEGKAEFGAKAKNRKFRFL